MGLSRVSCPEAASPVEDAATGPPSRPAVVRGARDRTRAAIAAETAIATEAAIARDVDTQP